MLCRHKAVGAPQCAEHDASMLPCNPLAPIAKPHMSHPCALCLVLDVEQGWLPSAALQQLSWFVPFVMCPSPSHPITHIVPTGEPGTELGCMRSPSLSVWFIGDVVGKQSQRIFICL